MQQATSSQVPAERSMGMGLIRSIESESSSDDSSSDSEESSSDSSEDDSPRLMIL